MHPPLPALALRSGLFIINPAGVLRQITVNDLPVGRSVDEVLRLVKAFQVRLPRGAAAAGGGSDWGGGRVRARAGVCVCVQGRVAQGRGCVPSSGAPDE